MNPSTKETSSVPETSPISFAFENQWKAYFSGEMVFGTVTFHARENQTVQTFSVYLRGEYYCPKGSAEHVESILVEASPMDYRGAGEGNIEMEFCLVLKPGAPTSIRTPLGGVRYRVHAAVVFREGGGLRVVEAAAPISVNHPAQLPELCAPRQVSTVERTGLICCVGAVSAELGVSSEFLLCGQAVVISASLFNGTHTSVQATSVSLVQCLQRQKDRKKMKRTVNSLQRGAVLPGKRQVWPSDLMVVPPLPPTSADQFFKTWYEVVMEIQKVGGLKVMKLKIPVVIGNLSASEVGIPNAKTENYNIEWKSSELENDSDEFVPLYVNHVA